jgi:hypothetical protein
VRDLAPARNVEHMIHERSRVAADHVPGAAPAGNVEHKIHELTQRSRP